MGDIGNIPQFIDRKVVTLENKDFDGGLASNQSRITLPRGTTAALAVLQLRPGMVAFDTTLDQMVVVDNSGAFVPAGGGGGGGSSSAPVNSIQASDGAGGFQSEAGVTFSGGAMSVTGGSSQNSFRSFSSASVNEMFFGRGASFGECFVISHWPDAGVPYTDLHLYSGPSNHLTLTRDGNVGMNSDALVYTSSVNSLKWGTVASGGSISASGQGTHAHGNADNGGIISSSNNGSIASGYSTGVDSEISATGSGAFAGGMANGGGKILAVAGSSIVFGRAHGVDSVLTSDQTGSLVHGMAADGGEISAGISAEGAQAFGFSRGVGTSIYAAAPGAFAWGQADGAASEIEASGIGSEAHGFANNAAVIEASEVGAVAHGNADNAGQILASQAGALAHGNADGTNLIASGTGSHAHGGGNLTASGGGSHAHGIGTITASATGSHAAGEGIITASQRSSMAFGLNEGGGGTIIESIGAGGGNLALGHVLSGGIVRATTGGSSAGGNLAHGSCRDSSQVIASGDATFAGGHSEGNGATRIEAGGTGAIAHGSAGGANSTVLANHASIAVGESAAGFSLSAGPWCSVFGSADLQDHSAGQWAQSFGNSNIVTGDLAAAHGIGHNNSSYASLIIGRFGELVETAGSWVDTETAFAIGNGTAIGAESLVYSVQKNGLQKLDATITAGGTTGNQTINKPSGTVNFAAAATTLTVTNSLVTANSLVYAVVRTNDATAVIKNVIPSAGSFVIRLSAAATAETSVGFMVVGNF